MKDVIIELSEVSKSYKLYKTPGDRLKEALHPFKKKYHEDFFALKDISFDIQKGEMVGVLGKNGSGKSTLLKLIARVLVPSSGSVKVTGNISALLELGAGFNPNFTGMQNIYFYGTILGFSREEMNAKIDSILAFADIGKFIHQPIKTYSSGMRARLAFAVSTEVDPEILIIDEVLAVGDMRFAAKCLRRMHEIREQDKTVILVTHDASKVAVFCDRAIWLKDGAIEAIGDAKYITEQYRDYMLMDTVAYEKLNPTEKDISVDRQDNTYVPVEEKKPLPEETSQGIETEEIGTIQKLEAGEFKFNSIEWTDLGKFPTINKSEISILQAALYKKGKARPASTFKRGEKAYLFVKLSSSADLYGINIGWVLVDNKGLIACHTNSSFCGETIEHLRKGKDYVCCFRFIIPPLRNGNYIINIGAKRNEEVICKVNDIFIMSILNDDKCSQQGGYVILDEMDFSYSSL